MKYNKVSNNVNGVRVEVASVDDTPEKRKQTIYRNTLVFFNLYAFPVWTPDRRTESRFKLFWLVVFIFVVVV